MSTTINPCARTALPPWTSWPKGEYARGDFSKPVPGGRVVMCARHDPQRSGLPFTATSAKVNGDGCAMMSLSGLNWNSSVAVTVKGNNSIVCMLNHRHNHNRHHHYRHQRQEYLHRRWQKRRPTCLDWCIYTPLALRRLPAKFGPNIKRHPADAKLVAI